MKKNIHIADGYDRIVEEDSDGTIHEVTAKPKSEKPSKAETKEGAAIDGFTRTGKSSSNLWI